MADRNLVLQLLISAKDEATSVFGKFFSYLDNNTRVVANLIRTAFTGLFGGGLQGAAEFEAQMDRVAAKGGYTAAEMKDLADQARLVGAEFGVSGAEAGQAMESLAAAGLSAKDAIGTLPSVLSLAKSEQISAAVASERLIDSLSVMGLGFEEAARMSDVLAKGANITTSSATQLAEALTAAGGNSRAAGMDLEYTVAALDLLHKNGIKGAEAGTALKSILTSLLDPSSKASEELNQLGITSRDLGTVIGALKERGDSANAAILAFGTEAGPGLRALLAEGQTGLNDYRLQLKNAEGAAQEAADAMGGNLKSAVASLMSIWESLKQTILEPLLEPLAQQARTLATTFQDLLADGSIKAVQDLMREFGTSVAEAITRFVRSFDFTDAKQAVTSFATTAKESFGIIERAGSVAAGVIQGAWNSLTASLKLLVGSFVSTGAGLFEVLSGIEAQAAKVGLGTVERAEELARKAQAMRDTARDLAGQAEQDMRDIADGAGRVSAAMTDVGQAADHAAGKLKEVKPPDLGNALELQPIVKTLGDYAGQLEQLKARQKEAEDAAMDAQTAYLLIGEQYDRNKVSLYAYEEAKRKDREAQDALKTAVEATVLAQSDYDRALQEAIRGIDDEARAATASIQTKQALFDRTKLATQQAGEEAKAHAAVGQAQEAALAAEIELARAKGQSATVRKLSAELAELEARNGLASAQAAKAEADSELGLAKLKRDQVAAKLAKNEATERELKLAELEVQKNLEIAKAAGVNVEAQEALLETLRQLGGSRSEQTKDIQENSKAVTDNSTFVDQASLKQEKHAKTVDNVGKMYQGLLVQLAQARERMSALSEGAAAFFEAVLQGELNARGLAGAFGASAQATQAFVNGVQSGSAELAKFEKAAGQAAAAEGRLRGEMLFTVNMFDTYATAVELAEATTRRAFNEQAADAERLRLRIEKMSRDGATDVAFLAQAAQRAEHGFDLLDEQDLSGLRSAIADANKKLAEMQQATEDARRRLGELNAELLEAQGADQKAAILRQQLSFQQELARIEAERAKAEALGNRDLVAILDEQRAKLEAINALKIRNIQADRTADDDQARRLRESTSRMNELTDASTRAAAAARSLADVDLSGLVGQAAALKNTFNDLNRML
jgi:TP901 family phage tail tape measure protein